MMYYLNISRPCSRVDVSVSYNLSGSDYIVRAWRTGGHRYTWCLAGLFVGGGVSRSPSGSQEQTMLSAPGVLEGTAALIVLLVYLVLEGCLGIFCWFLGCLGLLQELLM